ncbi:MAG: sigma 54-interacting transcriptional regulator [bacterium]
MDSVSDKNLYMSNSDLKQKLSQLTMLYDITRAVNSIIDRDELLKFILKKTKEILDVHGTSLIFWDPNEKMFYFPVVAEETSEIENHLKHLRFPKDKGIAGWVFCQGKPAIVQDVTKDKRFYKGIDEITKCMTKSVLCVPLRGTKEIFGVLEAVNKKNGAFTKDDQQLLLSMADNVAISIEKATLYAQLQKAEAMLRRQNAKLRRSVKQKYRFENIICCSDIFVDILKKAEQVALTDTTVLIYGETGTGKELIAQAIHNYSPRSSKNFVAINCGAIPENLLESELFGHEKGAFTNAHMRRIGHFEDANYGTVFLDEIGDMPLNLQVKLLRVLQEGTIQRLGTNNDIHIDVRLILATHQNLARLVEEGKFRQDLYYRLKVFELEIPPLRDRKNDIPLLIEHFIKIYNKKLGTHIQGVKSDALHILLHYVYPGNVRELEHIIERAIILCRSNLIGIDELPPELCDEKFSPKMMVDYEELYPLPRNNDELKAAKARARKKAEEKVELLFLKKLLPRTHGNISEAARQTKMNRSWLAQLVLKYKLDLKHYRKNS